MMMTKPRDSRVSAISQYDVQELSKKKLDSLAAKYLLFLIDIQVRLPHLAVGGFQYL